MSSYVECALVGMLTLHTKLSRTSVAISRILNFYEPPFCPGHALTFNRPVLHNHIGILYCAV